MLQIFLFLRIFLLNLKLDVFLSFAHRGTEILFSLMLAEMRRFRGDGRLADGFPIREHFQSLMAGRRSLALFQHHDAVTGTARDPVVVDYGTRWLSCYHVVRVKQLTLAVSMLTQQGERSEFKH